MTETSAKPAVADTPAKMVRYQMPLWRKLLAWVAIAAALLVFLVLFDEVLLPFVVGLAVAYFLDPVADWLEGHKAPRWLAATLALGLFALLALVIAILAFPLIQSQVIAAGDALPKYTAKVQLLFADILSYASSTLEPEDIARMREAMGAQVGRAMTLAGTVLKRLFDGGMALVNVTTFVFVTPIVAFYLLRDWDRLIGWVDALIPRPHVVVVREQARQVDDTLAGFVRGQATVCVVLGLGYGLALSLAGLEFGFVIGILSGILAFIPYVGSIFGLFASVGLALLQFDDPVRIGIIAGIFIVGQVLEGNVLTPKLVGERVGLHPVWVIFSLFAGGAVLGFMGMLLALPVAASVGVLTRFAVAQYRQSPIYLGDDHEDDDPGDDPGESPPEAEGASAT
jgi:predicted PurR-regulated permease PerM